MIDRFEKFTFAISELHNYLHKITRDEMADYDLKGPHAIYFFVLYRHPEGITAAELSEACFRNKADVSRAMTVFEEKGFVVRGNLASGYRAPIALTEKGRHAAERLRARAEVVVNQVGASLTDEQRAVFYESMERIAANMRSICKPEKD